MPRLSAAPQVELPRLLPVSALQRVWLVPRPVPGATGPPGVTALVAPFALTRPLFATAALGVQLRSAAGMVAPPVTAAVIFCDAEPLPAPGSVGSVGV